MQIGVERKTVEEKLASILRELRTDKFQAEQLRAKLLKHDILPDLTQQVINEKVALSELSLIVLCLFTIKTWEVVDKYPTIDPNKFFTEKEIKNAERYKAFIKEKIDYPIIFDDVIAVSAEEFLTTLSSQKLVNMYDSKLIEYNYETQRNPKYIRRKDGIVMAPNVNRKSVKEIAKKMNEGTLLTSTITLNLLSDGEDEFYYDENKKQLIIESGEINILDGFHRLMGTVESLRSLNPDINFTWQVSIRNYSTRKAQSFFVQANTINKVDKARTMALKQDRYSDVAVKELILDSDLKGKVSFSSRPVVSAGQIVSYTTLTDMIDKLFKLESKKDAIDLARYLTSFFDYLIGSYPQEFSEDIENMYRKSLMNNNIMFNGYLVLAKRFKEKNIPISYIYDTINNIDFSKDNPIWEQIGVIEKDKLARNAKQEIIIFFTNLEIEMKEEGIL